MKPTHAETHQLQFALEDPDEPHQRKASPIHHAGVCLHNPSLLLAFSLLSAPGLSPFVLLPTKISPETSAEKTSSFIYLAGFKLWTENEAKHQCCEKRLTAAGQILPHLICSVNFVVALGRNTVVGARCFRLELQVSAVIFFASYCFPSQIIFLTSRGRHSQHIEDKARMIDQGDTGCLTGAPLLRIP